MLELVSPDSAKGEEPGTPVALELRHRVAKGIRNPEVRPIEDYRVGNAVDREGAELVPSLAREFGHAAATVVRHPHVRPVKGYSITVFSDLRSLAATIGEAPL